ncbi:MULTISPECIES: glycosyltransferase [Bradyrhizobium]|uniref:glycosyltransferase n=1 Tax=Bradyrhizobium TaxID=374 RepID=UPI0013A55127|nr:glycosyltransferase [Bradyrhizobium diazoefficiens]AWO93187.2 glycosyltransferase [Bradyrhizobium diazoefficiens]WLA76422.1 glycosyltransferase [Bradyrhizobium diazoefficiens]
MCQQVEQLRRFGHTVDVIDILGSQSKMNYLRCTLDVVRMTSAVAYDIVHAHYGYSAYPAMFRLRAPLVITLHGTDVIGQSIFERLSTRAVSRFADAVIVVSEELRRRIPGIVIPCGVDLGVFKPYDRDKARARLGWPKDKHIVLFPFDPARPEKRYDLARASVERLVQEGVDAELTTVVNVPNGEMPWCYSAADALLLCSDYEGSPTSIKEALACNRPVVATDVGDVGELLNGIAGTRICPQEAGTIARNLREVFDWSRSSEFRGRAAMARYDQALTVEKIVGVYDDVLSNFKARTVDRRLLRSG